METKPADVATFVSGEKLFKQPPRMLSIALVALSPNPLANEPASAVVIAPLAASFPAAHVYAVANARRPSIAVRADIRSPVVPSKW